MNCGSSKTDGITKQDLILQALQIGTSDYDSAVLFTMWGKKKLNHWNTNITQYKTIALIYFASNGWLCKKEKMCIFS